MPNSLQAARRVKKARAAYMTNKSDRSEMRTSVKKLLLLIKAKQSEEASKLFPKVQKLLDTLAKKGIIASNASSRYKKRLNSKLKAIAN